MVGMACQCKDSFASKMSLSLCTFFFLDSKCWFHKKKALHKRSIPSWNPGENFVYIAHVYIIIYTVIYLDKWNYIYITSVIGFIVFSMIIQKEKREEMLLQKKKKKNIEYEKIININPLIGVASTAGHFCNFFFVK